MNKACISHTTGNCVETDCSTVTCITVQRCILSDTDDLVQLIIVLSNLLSLKMTYRQKTNFCR